MIIPSIDLMDKNAVQLVGGKELEINAGDPRPIAKKFGLVGEVAVIDLDAALNQGTNEETIKDLLKIADCRVGGGIRSVDAAIKWLDLGASKVILGSQAKPEILNELPRQRVIAALDAYNGEVVIDGWRTKTGKGIVERIKELEEFVGGFLITFVEREGRLQGTNLEFAMQLVEVAKESRITFAGGISSAEEIAELDKLGADAQVGMALYSRKLSLGDCFSAPLISDRPDGLFPTVVTDECGMLLGLTYSSRETLTEAIEIQKGIYYSRKRGRWLKGESSGNTQELISVSLDCDRDAVKFVVKQGGEGFCHLGTESCFGNEFHLAGLAKTISDRKLNAPAGSYTSRVLNEKDFVEGKILEEAREFCEEISGMNSERVKQEGADLVYFLLCGLAKGGVSLLEVEEELKHRNRKISRRSGDLKIAAK
jgi:phosphoribosyl-ATP pyrophosphohydrolase/phosphoribosyl-AMP cyclohydrolase